MIIKPTIHLDNGNVIPHEFTHVSHVLDMLLA